MNYCTLFDSNYLTRGIAMYESLKKNSENFHLYIYAFDERCYQLLQKLHLESATIISLKEFEDEELLKVKNGRTAVEYCWTCTPSVIKYSIEKYNLDSCTYLDADLYFFSNPVTLIDEMGDKSVLITEHRYTARYDKSATSGIYCVQFMTFKNNQNGMLVLNWWREACIEWCYFRIEDGKLGDQKYLDDWPIRFEGVHVLQHLGGGVAPWNIQQYKIYIENFKYFGVELTSKTKFRLIFYHFHSFKFIENDKVDLGGYTLTNNIIKMLYKPYIRHLEKINDEVKQLDGTFDFQGTREFVNNSKWYKLPFKKIIKKDYHLYNKSNFLR